MLLLAYHDYVMSALVIVKCWMITFVQGFGCLFDHLKGEKSFFLQPGENLRYGIQDINILGEDEGLILRAREGFTDNDAEVRRAQKLAQRTTDK